MEHYLLTAMWCLIVVTGVIVYMPMMYARKTEGLAADRGQYSQTVKL
jgi:hypothetical protein